MQLASFQKNLLLALIVFIFMPAVSALADSSAEELKRQSDKMRDYERFDEALRLIDQAIMKKPGWAALYSLKGQIYDDMGKDDLAVKDEKKAEQIRQAEAVKKI